MATKKHLPALLLCAAFLVSCGGGSDTPEPAPAPDPTPAPEPQPEPAALRFELLSGRTAADFSDCPADGFGHLIHMSQGNNGTLYVLDTAARCTNAAQPRLLPLTGTPEQERDFGWVSERALQLGWRASSALAGDDGLTVTVVAGVDERWLETFRPNAAAVQAISAQDDGWQTAVPGLYNVPVATFGMAYSTLVAGAPGHAPAVEGATPVLQDGSGREATLHAPHSLVRGADGDVYFLDGGQVRAATPSYTPIMHEWGMEYAWNVRTLNIAASNVIEPFVALAADAQGNIHALELVNAGGTDFVWHRLADGSQQAFSLDNAPDVATFLNSRTIASFAVIDGDMLLAVRRIKDGNATRLLRVSGRTGHVSELSGSAPSADASDFLAHPDQYRLPPVQHVFASAAGDVYLVLEQGIVVARGFTWPQPS